MEEQYGMHAEQSARKAENTDTPAAGKYVVPGAPIVRASTPRPMPFGVIPSKTELPLAPSEAASHFPTEAPEAPPVPEDSADETGASGTQGAATTSGLTGDSTSKTLASEFLWLFEYALDMDPALLNRPERLDGSAFAYGPAVLRGYRLVFEGLDTRGHVLASLVATPDRPEAEVWGILYRVPRRLTRRDDERASVLDKAHHAETFVSLDIQVRDTYRQREISCLTYIASPGTRQQVGQLAITERTPEPAYLKRLLQVARRQKLPGSYLEALEELVPTVIPAATPLPTTPPEHTTDPLPAVLPGHDLRKQATGTAEITLPGMSRESGLGQATGATKITLPGTPMESAIGPWDAPYPAYLERWMMSFALYVCLLLLGTLMLAIFQGLGVWGTVFNESFAPLGTPWYVLLYGLLGGCISCVLSLSRPRFTYPPAFVVLTWFIRPFLGATLGALAYLVLNSGIILLSAQPAQHFALCSLAGALAGFCEGRLLLGKKSKHSLA